MRGSVVVFVAVVATALVAATASSSGSSSNSDKMVDGIIAFEERMVRSLSGVDDELRSKADYVLVQAIAGVAQLPMSCRAAGGDPDVALVDARVWSSDYAGSAGVADLFARLGGVIVSSSARFGEVVGTVPVAVLAELILDDGIAYVRCASRPLGGVYKPAMVASTAPTANLNSAPTDLADALQVSLLRSEFKVSGKGITIGVLSDGVKDVPSLQESGLLPNVTVLSGQAGPSDGNEGTAILQLVHEVAPDASLYFATGFTSETSFADNIFALADAGCDIIIDDITYSNEPPLADSGPISIAAAAVALLGVVYISSAGNGGNAASGTSAVWEGAFCASSSSPLVHVFDISTQSTGLQVFGSPSVLFLWWSDQPRNATNDYNLYLVDSTGAVIDSSQNVQNGLQQDPFEGISNINFGQNGPLYMVVKKASDSVEDRYLRVSMWGGGQFSPGVGTSGQSFGHMTAPGVIGMAAVQAAGNEEAIISVSASLKPETFSSDGPRTVFFGLDNEPINNLTDFVSNGEVRQQPLFTGVDGVQTTVEGFQPFFGTSAAIATMAGYAAYILQTDRNNSITPTKLLQLFAASSVSIGNAALYVNITGHGFPNVAGVLDALQGCKTGSYVEPTSLACLPCPFNSTGIAMHLDGMVGLDSCVYLHVPGRFNRGSGSGSGSYYISSDSLAGSAAWRNTPLQSSSTFYLALWITAYLIFHTFIL